jgi:hypothetical protein
MTDVEAARTVNCKAILFDRTESRTSEPVIGAISVAEVAEIAPSLQRCLGQRGL